MVDPVLYNVDSSSKHNEYPSENTSLMKFMLLFEVFHHGLRESSNQESKYLLKGDHINSIVIINAKRI